MARQAIINTISWISNNYDGSKFKGERPSPHLWRYTAMCARTLVTHSVRMRANTHTHMLSAWIWHIGTVLCVSFDAINEAFGGKRRRRPRRVVTHVARGRHSDDKAHAIACRVYTGSALWAEQCTWPPAVNGPLIGPVDRRGPCALHNPLHPDSQQSLSVFTLKI